MTLEGGASSKWLHLCSLLHPSTLLSLDCGQQAKSLAWRSGTHLLISQERSPVSPKGNKYTMRQCWENIAVKSVSRSTDHSCSHNNPCSMPRFLGPRADNFSAFCRIQLSRATIASLLNHMPHFTVANQWKLCPLRRSESSSPALVTKRVLLSCHCCNREQLESMSYTRRAYRKQSNDIWPNSTTYAGFSSAFLIPLRFFFVCSQVCE